MSKLKKVLLLVATWAAVAALAITGTIAYLKSEDSAVNVMTLGNVEIEQLEYERVVDANGNWVESTYTGYGYTADEMQEFTQDKPAYPAVYRDGTVKWDDRNGSQAASGEGSHQQPWSQIGAPGTNQLFDDSVKNVIDKFVFVKNTGESDCYYRTYIAIEWAEELNERLLHINFNGNSRFTRTELGLVEHEGTEYLVYEMLYNEVLTPGEVSRPSLLQVYLDPAATNEDCAILGDTWKIIVLSQACQTAGFENAGATTFAAAPVSVADLALDTSFGEPMNINAENNAPLVAEWIFGTIEKYESEQTSVWDGTSDTAWYNDTDTEFTLTSAAQLAGLAELVDGGNTFEGKTVLLNCDIDMEMLDDNGEPISFDPIGSYQENKPFYGTFDGQGHTISNVYQNGWALANGYWDGDDWGMGLFALMENATVKNLTLEGSSLPSEANIMGTVAGLAANCTFENITVKDAYVGNHSWYSGGIVGWAEGDMKFINCDVDADSSISSQWGDFNNANGGIVGGIDPAGTYYFEDCDVACVIDAYNDVTSAYEWYAYRSCGMLIGDTGQMDDPDGNNVGNAIAPNVTCKNVTVTYGEWANYHYCEFGSAGYPFCRVEAGDSTGAYGNARVGEYTDANGNKVVDDNHAHNDGEAHNQLIVFDQLFGGEGGDRYCTYGTAAHEGVTVIYNNK